MNTSIIIGTLLGDAWIQKHPNRSNSYSFCFSQSIKDYCVWKAEQIGERYHLYERVRFDKRTKKSYYSCQATISIPSSKKKEYYNLFYKPKKIVTDEILNLVDNQAIAIWYLDDGNMYYNGNNCHITLSVNGFDDDSKKRIINWFKDNHNLHFKHSSKAIRITSKRECKTFMSIVEEFIPECMNYKILSEAEKKHISTMSKTGIKMRNKKLQMYARRKEI